VDGAPEVADAKVKGAWKTVLVGGLAGGGQGLYALDVTDPGTFSETRAANIVMWEFTDKDDPHLGNVYGKPVIRQMQNGEWAAIVSGGYNNSDSKSGADTSVSNTGRAYLFIIFLKGPADGATWQEGTDYIRIATDVGESDTPNGLADPFPADPGADGLIDFVYAGDLRGNLWKFDLRSTTAADWKSSSNRLKLFTAKDASNNPQPITTRPDGTIHPSGNGYIITFGTGKYIEQNDLKSANWKTQSFYGIWDKNDGTVINSRSDLVQQTISVVSTGTETYRTLTNHAVDSPKRGWFMDFPISGERSVFRPLLIRGRLIFTTLVPSVNACDFGGKSFMMIVSPTTGGRIDAPVLDINADAVLDANDKVGATPLYASGVQSKAGIAPTPVIVTGRAGWGGTDGNSGRYRGTETATMAGQQNQTALAISTGREIWLIGLASSGGRITWREVLAR
jgi:type IV pilus assembly protein PilY1